jgi:hypothetical protein
MTMQFDFLRFTDWKNDFNLEEFKSFLAEFDIYQPDFLAWIEQHQAPYIYFEFYSLLVKNYLNHQQDIAKILDFILSQKESARDAFISFIKEPQKKYPDILDIVKFEQALLQYFTQYDISSYFTEIKSLFRACCLHYFRFQKIPTYLCQHVTAENYDLVQDLTQCSYWHNQDYGILDKLLEFTPHGHRYSIFDDLKNWSGSSEDLIVREKIAVITRYILNDLLKDHTPYYSEIYLKSLKDYETSMIGGYIDFCRYLPNSQTKDLLNQLIENQNLHISIRFESVLIYFLTFQQQHHLKEQLTQQLLTLPLSQRWGSSSSYTGMVNSSDLFKQTDFFSLDDILLALHSTQWCYEACKPLHNYTHDAVLQQKIILATIEAIAAMIQRMLGVSAGQYLDTQYIGYLSDVLKNYTLTVQQRQQLEHILLDGLRQFISHFTEQKYLHTEMIELIYSLGFAVPHEYLDLLSVWTKLAFSWKARGLTKADVWQKLIDAEVIASDAEAESLEGFIHQVLPHLDFITYDSRNNDNPFRYEIFHHYFKYPIKWLTEEDFNQMPSEQFFDINHENPELEWKSIDYFYFKCNEQYYRFFIYNHREWVNNKSFLEVFNKILKHFNSDRAVYELEGTDDLFGRDKVYFSVNPDKFDPINQIINIPCVKPTFFIPEAKSLQFLAIENQFKNIIEVCGFISKLNQMFIEIPSPQAVGSKDAQKWLISMIGEMRSQALVFLLHEDFFEQAIDIRNLFISLALNMIGDYCVANQLKGKNPLWERTRYQGDNSDQQQRIKQLDHIFEENDLANYLKYPY